MIIIPPLAQPGDRYDRQNETETRRAVETALQNISNAMVAPFGLTVIGPESASSTVTAVPAALTEWQGVTRNRTEIDLRDYQSVELVTYVVTAGSANAEMRWQYTADLTGASGWAYMDGTSGPNVNLHTTGSKRSQVNIIQAARGRVLLRPISINGDGATNAAVGLTRLVLR